MIMGLLCPTIKLEYDLVHNDWIVPIQQAAGLAHVESDLAVGALDHW